MGAIRPSAKFLLTHLEIPLKKIYERSRQARNLMQFTEKSIKTTATSSDLNLYNRKAVYLTSKAQETLGYCPRYDVETGLQKSVAWLKHLGLAD
jgi:nucleoside-diphosphate-sugar epimerase